MKYTKSKNYLNDRFKKLKKYTSSQELEVLLLEDNATPIEVLSILSNIKTTNETEAMAFIFKLREISVSDLIEITKSCSECNYMNVHNIEIDEFFNLDINTELPLGIFSEPEDIINTKTANKLILKEYIKIKKELEENTSKVFKLSVKRVCQRCKEQEEIYINPISIISKSSQISIFKEYVDISFYSNITKLDVDSMFPFQREITLNLLTEKLKEQVQVPKGL